MRGISIRFGPEPDKAEAETPAPEPAPTPTPEPAPSPQSEPTPVAQDPPPDPQPPAPADEEEEVFDDIDLQDKIEETEQQNQETIETLGEQRTMDFNWRGRLDPSDSDSTSILDSGSLRINPDIVRQPDIKLDPNLFAKMKKFTDSEPNQPINLSVEDSELPIINRLGCGYNVFGHYASNASVRNPVLNLRKLVEDKRAVAFSIRTYRTVSTVAESVRDYSKKVTHKAGVKGGYLCFNGSITTSFSSEQLKQTMNYYATHDQVYQMYKTYILAMTDYKNYLTPDAYKAINSNDISANQLFHDFGHFVLVNAIIGGKVSTAITNTSTSSKTIDNFELDTKASCNVIYANISGSYSNQTSKTKSSYDSTKKLDITFQGGEPISKDALEDPARMRQWEQSLATQGELIAFDEESTCLIPIWELCDNSSRADYLENEFIKLAQVNDSDMPIPTHYQRKYVTAINIGMNTDDQKARAEAAMGGRVVIEPELNHKAGGQYVYLGIEYGPAGDYAGALTDLLISTHHKGSWHEFAHHEQTDDYVLVRKNEQASGKYTVRWCNLNHEAGGDSLYLYASFAYSPRKAPIYDVMVYDATVETGTGDMDICIPAVLNYAEENGWEVVNFAFSETPANLNHNAGGNRLFLLVKKDYSMILPSE